MTSDTLEAGQRVRVTHEVDRREGTWIGEVVGTILSVTEEKTGSWFAHAKDGRLWLRRIRLQKDDGEITIVSLDRHTSVELLDDETASE